MEGNENTYYKVLKLYMNLYYLKVEYYKLKMNTVNPRIMTKNIEQRICTASRPIVKINLDTEGGAWVAQR